MCLLSRYSQYHLSRRPTSYACFELSLGWHYPHVCQLWSHTALQCSVICPRNLPDMDTQCYQSIADQFSTCHGATSCIVPDVSGTSLDPCYGTLNISKSCTPALHVSLEWYLAIKNTTQIARFMGPTWGPSGADRTQVGPMWATWTLLSGNILYR